MQYRPRREASNAVVRMVVSRHDESVAVRNITPQGLQIQGDYDAVEGDSITLFLRGRQYRGKVVWVSDDALGMAFGEPLNAADMAHFTGRTNKTDTKARHRVGFGAGPVLRR